MQSVVAKTSDPVTSWEAGESFCASTAKAVHFNIILGAMGAGPMTSLELSRNCTLDRHQVARRLSEMEQESLVERCPIRRAGLTAAEA